MLILSVELTIRRDFHLFASLSYIIGLARNATSSSYITTNAIYGDRTAITSDKVYKSCHFFRDTDRIYNKYEEITLATKLRLI